jgi:hypothetical protein
LSLYTNKFNNSQKDEIPIKNVYTLYKLKRGIKMSLPPNELYTFADEDNSVDKSDSWKILIISSQSSRQSIYDNLFKKFRFDKKGICPCYISSLKLAGEYIKKNSDTAIILLDCNLESTDAVINFIKYIREELKLSFIRILLANVDYDDKDIDNILDYDLTELIKKSDFNRLRERSFNCVSIKLS